VPIVIILRDSSDKKIQGIGEFIMTPPDGKRIKHKFTVDLKKAKTTWFDVRVTRVGAKLTFTCSAIKKLTTNANVGQAHWKYTKQFNVPELKNTPITGTTYWVQSRYAKKAVPVLKESLTNFLFRWINVEKYSDDPNHYMEGDVLSYDGNSGKF